MRGIKVLTVGDLSEGMFVTDVDADYPLDSLVPGTDYDAEEQDWNRVARVHGYVDLRTLVLEYHNGVPHTAECQSSAAVWVLVERNPSQDGKGIWEPVVQDEPNS